MFSQSIADDVKYAFEDSNLKNIQWGTFLSHDPTSILTYGGDQKLVLSQGDCPNGTGPVQDMTFWTVTETDLSMSGLALRKFFDIDKTTGYAGIWFSKTYPDGKAVNQLVKFTYSPYMFDSEDPLYFSTNNFDQCVYLYDLGYNPDSEAPSIAQYDLMVCIGDKTATPEAKIQDDTWPKAVYVYQILKDQWRLAANKIYVSSELENLCPVNLTMKSFDHNFLMTSRCPGDARTSVVGINLNPDTLEIDSIDW